MAAYLAQHADYSDLEGEIAPALTIMKDRKMALPILDDPDESGDLEDQEEDI